jgi:hypothetical protein
VNGIKIFVKNKKLFATPPAQMTGTPRALPPMLSKNRPQAAGYQADGRGGLSVM